MFVVMECRHKGRRAASSLVNFVADVLLHLPHLSEPQSFTALLRWLRVLPPYLAPVLFVSTMAGPPTLLRSAAQSHASHASVAFVHPGVLPRRLRSAVLGSGSAQDAFAVLPPAAAAYMSSAGAPTTPASPPSCVCV
jgi:hypothetical protein